MARNRESIDREIASAPMPVRGRLAIRNRRPGVHYRWVAALSMGMETDQNVLNRLDEGYVPVSPSEVGHTVRSLPGRPAADTDLVVNGGLILMAMPEDVAAKQRAARAARGTEMLHKIREEMAGDPGVAIQVERQSVTTRGRRARMDGDLQGG